MTNTPTKKENQKAPDNVPSANPNEQKKNNRNNDRKRNRRGDSKIMREILSGKKELFKLEEYLKL